MPTLKKEQLEAVLHDNGNILVSASAGSGKTHVMIERLIRIITEGKATVRQRLAKRPVSRNAHTNAQTQTIQESNTDVENEKTSVKRRVNKSNSIAGSVKKEIQTEGFFLEERSNSVFAPSFRARERAALWDNP